MRQDISGALLALLALLAVGGAACPPTGRGGLVATPPRERPPRPLAPALRQRAEQGLREVRRGDFITGRQHLLSALEQAEGEERIALLCALVHAEQQSGERAALRQHAAELLELSDRPAERAFARQALGLPEPEPAGRPAEAEPAPAVGVLVPGSGSFRLAGQELLTGALAGAGVLSGARLRLLIEDDSSDPAAAARALLKRGALALLGGAARPESARAVAQAARQVSAPFLSAACGDPLGEGALCLLPSQPARARSLAAQALAAGARRFAVLAPRSGFGRSMTEHFVAALRQAGGILAVELGYAEGARSFGPELRRLGEQAFEGLFVPDSARQLALLAPALPAAGISPAARPAAAGAVAGRRQVLVVSTADGLNSAPLGEVSRYLQGALLAPGFVAEGVPDESLPSLRALERELGHPPSLLEAYAADAMTALRAAMESGQRHRSALLDFLRQGAAQQGLTGPLRFAADGGRASPVFVYRVAGKRLRLLPPR